MIFTSSGAALKGYAGWGAYGSSKAALHSLVQHIAVEESIVAISVGPGRVDTNMQKELREKGGSAMAEKDYDSFVSAFDEGKLNKPEWPGEVIARLSLQGKSELSGKYIQLVNTVAWLGYDSLTILGGMLPSCRNIEGIRRVYVLFDG